MTVFLLHHLSHLDVAKGLGREMQSTLRVVYLTARPLRHLPHTRRFIAGAGAGDQPLPPGPLFCNKVANP